MNLSKLIERAYVGVQAEADQANAGIVEQVARSRESYGHFITVIECVLENPESMRSMDANDLECIADIFVYSAINVVQAARERMCKELGNNERNGQ